MEIVEIPSNTHFLKWISIEKTLGKWLKQSSAYDLVYIPKCQIIQKIQNNIVTISQVIKTRTKITNSCVWHPQPHRRPGIPLIENKPMQSLPSMQWPLTPSLTPWATKQDENWIQCQSTLNQYTTVTSDHECILLKVGVHERPRRTPPILG